MRSIHKPVFTVKMIKKTKLRDFKEIIIIFSSSNIYYASLSTKGYGVAIITYYDLFDIFCMRECTSLFLFLFKKKKKLKWFHI